MKLVPLGPPNSGKGTLSKKISSALYIPHLSTGEIFKRLAEEGSPIGIKARDDYWIHGNLVPDEPTIELVREMLSKPEYQKDFILDGFPRTRQQAKALDKMVQNYTVFLLEIKQDELLRRVQGRRICKLRKCGAIYNINTNPPKLENKCDECNSDLYQRDDDKIEIFRERISVYEKEMAGILDYYGSRIIRLDGEQRPYEIFLDVLKL